jgi:EAL domain-containing protein (putative c-di-GMP-specific phosphodiesterase class I)
MLLEPGGLQTVFQPVFELRPEGWQLHALECLSRGPSGTNLERADVLFEYVRRKQEECRVDRACVATALLAASSLPGQPRLCLNVHASTLVKYREFPEFLQGVAEANLIAASRVTVEIVEHIPFWDAPRLTIVLDRLRKIGVSIALDDIGLGQSNYRMILDIRPNYFKIDRYLVRGSHPDYYRRSVIESIVHLAGRFGAKVVAEGIEELADLEAVTGLGVALIQGHLLAPALPASKLVASGVLEGLFLRPGATHAMTIRSS